MYSVYIGEEDTRLEFVLAMFCDLQIWSVVSFILVPSLFRLKKSFFYAKMLIKN